MNPNSVRILFPCWEKEEKKTNKEMYLEKREVVSELEIWYWTAIGDMRVLQSMAVKWRYTLVILIVLVFCVFIQVQWLSSDLEVQDLEVQLLNKLCYWIMVGGGGWWGGDHPGEVGHGKGSMQGQYWVHAAAAIVQWDGLDKSRHYLPQDYNLARPAHPISAYQCAHCLMRHQVL